MNARHVVALAALVVACRAEPKPEATTPPAPATTNLTAQDLFDASYHLVFVENDLGTVAFTDSVARDTVNRTFIKLFRTATGDLDGDGNGDGVAFIGMNFGGTGTFVSAVPVLNRDGKPVQGRAAALGDRTRIQAVTVDSGVVTVEMIAHGPNDAACCPTDTVSQRFRLVGDSLTLQP